MGEIDEKGIEYAAHPEEKEKDLEKLHGRLIEFNAEFVESRQAGDCSSLKGGVITSLDWKTIQ
ncbi:MAG: hypothetical protein LBO72_07970 [Helicobacteraceae bacterium]|nr:hypothetical protein [Helicobacteraceae bacterium]